MFLSNLTTKKQKKIDLIIKLLTVIIIKENRMADAVKDLQDAVARQEISLSAELKAIADKLGSFGGAVPADVAEGIVTRINAVSDQLDAESASLVPVVTST